MKQKKATNARKKNENWIQNSTAVSSGTYPDKHHLRQVNIAMAHVFYEAVHRKRPTTVRKLGIT